MSKFGDWFDSRSRGAEAFRVLIYCVVLGSAIWFVKNDPIEKTLYAAHFAMELFGGGDSEPASYARSDRENIEIVKEAKRQRRDAKVFACERVYTKRNELITCLSEIEVD